MARRATKKTKKAAKKRSAGKPAAASRTSAKGRRKSGAGTEVEKRWQEYWDCRKRLEETVELVRSAREALQQAQEAERARRIEFDKVKGTLTTLLDVEPATSAQPRPIELAADFGRTPPKQVG
jgi:hypothetical protein